MLGLLLFLFLVLALFYGRPVIQNDGISYYGLTISLLKDHDFDLENQYIEHREIRVLQGPDGKIGSYYSCGIAFLYLPFLYVMDLFSVLREFRPYAQNVRFPFSHTFGFFSGSIFYSFLSVALAYYVLVRHQKLSPIASLLISVSCFIGTPLVFYTFTVPSFAHASDTFLVTCSFVLAISTNEWRLGPIHFRKVLLGFVLAFSVLLRNNNIVIVPVLVLGVIYLEREKGFKNAVHTCFEILAGALPVLMIHVFFNLGQYGKLIATGYAVSVAKHAQARLFKFFWLFFHPVAGIYPWSPIALLGTIGLILAFFKKRRHAIVAVAVVSIVIISIRFAAIIFPGSTFGQRLLTHLYVFWAFGLSELFLRFRKISTVLAAICVLWGFLLFNTYFVLTGSRQINILLKNGGSNPIEWICTTIESYKIAKREGTTRNPIDFWWMNMSARPYPVLIHILFNQEGSQQSSSLLPLIGFRIPKWSG